MYIDVQLETSTVPSGLSQAGMGLRVHWLPSGQVPSVVLLARNSVLRPPSPYCTHCWSPANLAPENIYGSWKYFMT